MSTQPGLWKEEVGWEVIDEMHAEGDSYGTIIKLCREICGDAPSPGTLSNHFNKKVKEATALRNKLKRQTTIGLFQKRLSDYKNAYKYVGKARPKSSIQNTKEIFRIRMKDFRKGVKVTVSSYKDYLAYQELHHGLDRTDEDSWKITCEVCGDPLVVSHENSQDWVLDHRIPKSKDGSGDPDNLAIIHHKCNQIKTSLSLTELHKFCQKVTEYTTKNSS